MCSCGAFSRLGRSAVRLQISELCGVVPRWTLDTKKEKLDEICPEEEQRLDTVSRHALGKSSQPGYWLLRLC